MIFFSNTGVEAILKNYSLKNRINDLINPILSWPAAVWVIGSFIPVFFFYFIFPTFLNAYHELHFFYGFPELKPLGADLHEYLNFSKALVETGTPYIPPNYYPPFQAVVFLRFMSSGPDQAYIYLTLLTFGLFVGVTFIYPLVTSTHRKLNLLAACFAVLGLFSYGFLFEIERGQFDVLTIALCYLALYIYHRHPRWRLAAYVLFVMSVNLKVYTGIFILCFTTDWRDWKNNFRRWGLLLAANFAGLFILGWKVFLDFVNAMRGELGRPSYWWTGNHSIDSFLRVMVEYYKNLNPGLSAALQKNSQWIEMVLLLAYLLCLGGVIWLTYRQNMKANNPYLLLMITIGAMIIPSTSHDYKLCILVPAMIVLYNELELIRSGNNLLDFTAILLVSLISIAYSATLFLHTDLPILLESNFPALGILTAATVALLVIQSAQIKIKKTAPSAAENVTNS